MDCVILAGGQGARLRSVLPAIPKPLAPIQGVPFISILLAKIFSFPCVSRCILSLGYLANSIEQSLANSPYPLLFLQEPFPLGTGGALQYIAPHITSSSVFIANGDTFFDMDMDRMLQYHREKKGQGVIACRQMEESSRYGTIQIDSTNTITSFAEKNHSTSSGLINGGVYLLETSLVQNMQNTPPFSLEKDFFPSILDKILYAQVFDSFFLDIGTPESYQSAQSLLLPFAQKLQQTTKDFSPRA